MEKCRISSACWHTEACVILLLLAFTHPMQNACTSALGHNETARVSGGTCRQFVLLSLLTFINTSQCSVSISSVWRANWDIVIQYTYNTIYLVVKKKMQHPVIHITRVGLFPGGLFFWMGLFPYTNRAITRELLREDKRNRETQPKKVDTENIYTLQDRETYCRVNTKTEIHWRKEMKWAMKRNERMTGVLT